MCGRERDTCCVNCGGFTVLEVLEQHIDVALRYVAEGAGEHGWMGRLGNL